MDELLGLAVGALPFLKLTTDDVLKIPFTVTTGLVDMVEALWFCEKTVKLDVPVTSSAPLRVCTRLQV